MSPRPAEIPAEAATSAPCRLLTWDSAFFGRRIARVTAGRLDPTTAERIRRWCQAHEIDCVYLLVAAGDRDTPRLAEAEGFRLVDVRITLGRALGGGDRGETWPGAPDHHGVLSSGGRAGASSGGQGEASPSDRLDVKPGGRAGGPAQVATLGAPPGPSQLPGTSQALEHAASGEPPTGARPFIRPAVAADLPELRRIAGESHRDSRFYYDGCFERARCDELYAVWIEKSCRAAWEGREGPHPSQGESRGAAREEVLVAELDEGGPPAGYITCALGAHDIAGAAATIPPPGEAAGEEGMPGTRTEGPVGPDSRQGRIGLFAVAPGAQGRGLGGQLIAAALGWLAAQGATVVEVVTQGRNTRAQRSYQRAGLLTRSVELWYHRWYEGRGNDG